MPCLIPTKRSSSDLTVRLSAFHLTLRSKIAYLENLSARNGTEGYEGCIMHKEKMLLMAVSLGIDTKQEALFIYFPSSGKTQIVWIKRHTIVVFMCNHVCVCVRNFSGPGRTQQDVKR